MNLENEPHFQEEVNSFLKEVYVKYGYDFSGYCKPSVSRRICRFIGNKNLSGIDGLKKLVFDDSNNFEIFLQDFTVNVTEMFRDPSFFVSLRKNVLPVLSTYPYIKIWDAGCSTGEELYSLSIILEEEGLLSKTRIYATDINQKVLKKAKEGVYTSEQVALYESNYYKAGGKREFSDYYQSKYNHVKFSSHLIKNVVFYPHNLVSDFSFNEFHLIICRNVLIYFTKELQDRVFKLFDDSLIQLGFLGLGGKETMALSEVNKKFILTDSQERLYRKLSE